MPASSRIELHQAHVALPGVAQLREPGGVRLGGGLHRVGARAAAARAGLEVAGRVGTTT